MLHAGCFMVREEVVGQLIEDGCDKIALRYALCGTGDRMLMAVGGAQVRARGCGHSLCPRCGRRRGSRYVRRVLGWLAYEGHGDLWNVCLTQRVIQGEALRASRDRMAVKCRSFMRWLTRRGLVGATTAHHVVWSKDRGGYHYHVHIVVEVPGGAFTREQGEKPGEWFSPEMRAEWASIGEVEGERLAPLFCVPLVGAGGAIESLREDGGDAEFWRESTNEVARVVQYPMRDMAQGVSAWRLGGSREMVREVVKDLLWNAKGWKLRRCWGRWRKVCPAAELAAKQRDDRPEAETPEPDEGKKVVAPGAKGRDLGTVKRVWLSARAGDAEARAAMKSLELSVRNKGDFAKRLVKYCRMAWGAGGDST